MNSTHPLAQLTWVRLVEFSREHEAIFWVFIFPIILAGGLGLAFRNRPEDILKITVDDPVLAESLKIERALDVTVQPAAEGIIALRRGKVALEVGRKSDGTVEFAFDRTNPEGRRARALADRAIQRSAGQVDPVKTDDIPLDEPGSRYIDFLMPGLLGMNLMSSAIWGTAFNIVDARKKKLLKRLMATPLPRPYYLIAMGLSHLVLLTAEVNVLLLFGTFAFHVPLRGSPVTLAFLCILSSWSFTALGLLLAARVQTTEAASGWMNLTMMPMWVLSGVFFSAQRFPDWLQPFITILPLTAVNQALRANMLQGAGIGELMPQVAILTVWLVVCFALALKLFRWK